MEKQIIQTTPFKLDPFQEEAIDALKSGISVVVSAPTGSGKTAIAEFVIEEALKGHERVFYTTPLKALSNQKFHDFQKKYGEKKVGILTGDTAVNRDAQILVMTTEIYRNMLYGTVLGSVDENLRRLRYLVLDECHYMNDPERGTVWEESIIYSPINVQILALSATIANANELTEWITNVHGETKLVESFERPVPLRFYYYKDHSIAPLLTTNGKLNPNLKEIKDSHKASRLPYRERHRLKKDFSSEMADLIKELNNKGFLPAIYFVFSRRGCEASLRDCRNIGFNLLTPKEKDELSKLIQEKTYGNEYLFRHKQLGYLYQGLAVHHAGQLPQWKTLIEELFSKGLIKVVFATETLAAGINMPAKTTIISKLSKRGDFGHGELTSNQFLQMSGRAGRRGMDKVGNVVVKHTNEHKPVFAAKLAISPPNPLQSQFTPNYSMVLNLLQNHNINEIKLLLQKCFGQYLINKEIIELKKEKEILESTLPKLMHYPCPDPQNPGDIRIFRKQEEKIKEVRRLIKMLEEQENKEKNVFEEELNELLKIHHGFPCYPCPHKKDCFKKEKRARKTEQELKELTKAMNNMENYYLNRFLKIANILQHFSYIKNDIPTETGIMASSLRGENILLITEVLQKSNFKKLLPSEFAACISCLALDENRPRIFTKLRVSNKVFDQIENMNRITKEIIRVQRNNDVEISTNISSILSGLIEKWCHEDTKWEDVIIMTNLDEGDIVRAARRTMDLLRHIKNAPYMKEELKILAKNAFDLMDKEPVKEIV
ncbi:MAG: DEAD/DEAH box helicase [Candidatus Melainabacteria bacterium]|nr:DEAD/DEAH box helicase [Candidatus Melainabacteria bacterium]